MINVQLLHYELIQAGLPVVSVATNGRVDYSRALTAEEQIAADAIIAAHDPDGDFPWEINKKDVKARLLIHALKGKIPAEIYTIMQDRMDAWTSLADARSDLREWLPLMAAVVMWSVGLQDNE